MSDLYKKLTPTCKPNRFYLSTQALALIRVYPAFHPWLKKILPQNLARFVS